ncbi:YdhK family protein [Carnobacterium jeotgali]|uniref:YdhK family protein n=1 Tax=Carnobacterium jeotgali TaxID=545534 RepID=UPI00049364DF|nr:YdhK family protein [Carnobacterium jeotgali]
MKNRKIYLTVATLATALTLAACGTGNEETDTASSESSSSTSMNMEGMMHNDSGEIPADLEKAEDPKYEVGSTVVIQADHMEGMKGAEATIVGAFNTTVYEVSYQPTTGSERVENHKWVTQEEIEEAQDEVIANGNEVTLKADHMEGMDDAPATIEASETTTIYMIDYEPTTGGDTVKNHKWVTEKELSED